MLGHITFVFTVLCIAVMLTLCQYDYTGKPIRKLWPLFLVTAIAFAWMLLLDLCDIEKEWGALVFRGSISMTAIGVLIYNWWVENGSRHRRYKADERHDPEPDSGVVR